MRWRFLLGTIFAVFTIVLLVFYWFIPYGSLEFSFDPANTNFSMNESNLQKVQFYPNMRFPTPDISFDIDDCTLQKRHDAERAFEILENLTILDFTQVDSGGDIIVRCESQSKIQGDLFIAGEGGPTNVTQAGDFNVILNGMILLLRQSSCPNPNIALHEILHALGFEHSDNPSNIMYPVSKCSQTIGQDTIDLINKLYGIESLPDLAFEDASATMHGKYLDLNVSFRNEGLKESEPFEILIYADSDLVKKFEVAPLGIGYGTKVVLKNIWIKQLSVEKIDLIINSFEDLSRENNKITLEIKK